MKPSTSAVDRARRLANSIPGVLLASDFSLLAQMIAEYKQGRPGPKPPQPGPGDGNHRPAHEEAIFDRTPNTNKMTRMGSRRRRKLSDQVRAAIDDCEFSRYRIGQLSGVDHGTISRFMSGERGISTDALDAIAEVIGLKVTVSKRPRK